MSGECSFFRFCLRGNDSLASKWISQKRKIGKLREDGANIYSISDYIHHVFCFEKLYGTEYTSNMLFNRIIEANHLDKNDIVKFDEEIVIPFIFSPRKYKKPSFDELAKEVKNEPVADFKLGDSLDENEIKEMLINTYHINYDIRSNENIADKTYDEIIREGFLDFKDDAELSFFLPYIFEIPTKKVVESSVETPVEISLTESAVQPEIVETAVEGYFYTMNGEYAGKYGNSEICYVLNTNIDNNKEKDGSGKYLENQVISININHTNFIITCNYIYEEASYANSKEECLWIAHATNNAKSVKDVHEIHSTMLEQLNASGYSSAKNKVNGQGLSDNLTTLRANYSRYAVIDVLLGKKDPTSNAVLWDGVDFLTKGKNHNKFKEYKSITISYDILKVYDDSISSARADVFNKYINDKKDLLEFGNGKWHTIIATGSHGKSIFWKLGE